MAKCIICRKNVELISSQAAWCDRGVGGIGEIHCLQCMPSYMTPGMQQRHDMGRIGFDR